MTVAERGCQNSSSRSTAQPNGSDKEGSANLVLEGGEAQNSAACFIRPSKSFSLFTGFYTLVQISMSFFIIFFLCYLWFLM